MENKREYIRVGTTLYKIVRRPLISGDFIEEKILWSYEALRQDYGKNNLPEIEKYDGFCIIPSHINYQQVYGTFLNQYEPVNHMPCEGAFPYIRLFLEHIFEEQIELGLDYIQLLYIRPTQMLPILLLVSNERETGKTTFLKFLKTIFGKNATFNTNEDFKSQFNADWANRLLVLVDELLLNKMEDTEKIKNLSTAGDYKIEAKGKDRREIEFFAKFVLCSNNEKNPIIIPREEIRFWVRKIRPVEKDITSLKELMAKEIPYFLHFLMNRKLSTQNESRMWFNPSLLETPALNKIKKYNSSKVEIEIASYCADVMERLNLTRIYCCPKDFLDVIRNAGLKADLPQIRNILKDSWGLRSGHNSDYTFYSTGLNGEISSLERKGRYLEVGKSVIDKILL
ncbi:MAG: helicase [Bacteroidetes bacterium GWD2_45_23]|nr:MAG: helicase [Bacteroidetes bacterium GWC2_46_850]OFX85078.1 MAG: helicase [Bacteroidetes bacterium GWD2_45_23]HBB00392.1 helicase [Porphyromonadaceae bacterium]HCC18409.1 helicase [Porphyromonadaceae bacterium]